MNKKYLVSQCVFILFAATVNATPVQMQFTATIIEATGSYAAMSAGDSILGDVIYDTDESVATHADTVPGVEPGHEFTSRYTLPDMPYGFSILQPDTAFTFTNKVMGGSPLEVLVNNDLALTSEETGGLIGDGLYDWLEILGSTASDIAGPYTPGNGQEWTLALIANDSNWFVDGSVMPDLLPVLYTTILVGVDLDANGNEIGVVFASVAQVPTPTSVWLLTAGLAGYVLIRRKVNNY